MDIKSMKATVAIVITIVGQAFGLIWYVAQLDSTVTNLDSTVATMQESQATVDVAVLQTTVEGLKEKLDSMEVFDSSDLEEGLDELEARLTNVATTQAVITNEMRTIMSDHSGFNDALKELGLSGYADKRTYGNYGQ